MVIPSIIPGIHLAPEAAATGAASRLIEGSVTVAAVLRVDLASMMTDLRRARAQ
jgi:hypothetical protein